MQTIQIIEFRLMKELPIHVLMKKILKPELLILRINLHQKFDTTSIILI